MGARRPLLRRTSTRGGAKRHGLTVDERRLARDLGVPVIPTAARQKEGLPELLKAIHDVATGAFVCKPHRIKPESAAIKNAINELSAQIEAAFPNVPNARWVALRLLDGDQRLADAIRSGELGNLSSQASDATQNLVIHLEKA